MSDSGRESGFSLMSSPLSDKEQGDSVLDCNDTGVVCNKLGLLRTWFSESSWGIKVIEQFRQLIYRLY